MRAFARRTRRHLGHQGRGTLVEPGASASGWGGRRAGRKHIASCIARARTWHSRRARRARGHAAYPRRRAGRGGRSRRSRALDPESCLMLRPRIFVTQPIPKSALERLKTFGEVEWNRDAVHLMTESELAIALRGHDILFCLLPDRLGAELIAASPALRMIATMKITPSDIDVAAATARRIPVTVIPPVVTEATADLHFALLLAVARRIVEGDHLL